MNSRADELKAAANAAQKANRERRAVDLRQAEALEQIADQMTIINAKLEKIIVAIGMPKRS